nr:unnamed protein product [Callosobruchus analis]
MVIKLFVKECPNRDKSIVAGKRKGRLYTPKYMETGKVLKQSRKMYHTRIQTSRVQRLLNNVGSCPKTKQLEDLHLYSLGDPFLVKIMLVFGKIRLQETHEKDQVIIARLRMGHTRPTHSHILLNTTAPRYETCRCQLSVTHILFKCPVYAPALTAGSKFLRVPATSPRLLLVSQHRKKR